MLIQYFKVGKNAIKRVRLPCQNFRNTDVRLRIHVLAYNLANFMRTPALPKEVEHWSLTTLREKLVKIEAKAVRQCRYVTFQLAEVSVPRNLFREILRLIDGLRRSASGAAWVWGRNGDDGRRSVSGRDKICLNRADTGGQVAQFCAIRSRARVLISRSGLCVYHQAQFEIYLRNVR